MLDNARSKCDITSCGDNVVDKLSVAERVTQRIRMRIVYYRSPKMISTRKCDVNCLATRSEGRCDE